MLNSITNFLLDNVITYFLVSTLSAVLSALVTWSIKRKQLEYEYTLHLNSEVDKKIKLVIEKYEKIVKEQEEKINKLERELSDLKMSYELTLKENLQLKERCHKLEIDLALLRGRLHTMETKVNNHGRRT